MKKSVFFSVLCIGLLTFPLMGCSSSKAKKALGMGRQSPDEFAVVERAPLTLPPSYELHAPQPGAPRPQEISTTAQARQLVTGENTVKTAGMSTSEAALLEEIGATQADNNIRTVLNQEYGVVSEGSKSERTIDKLNPFKDDVTTGKTIDPNEEAKTLRDQGVSAPKPVTAEELKQKTAK